MMVRAVAAAIVLGFAVYWLFRMRRWVAAAWFLVALHRWLTGQPHHGRPVTDRGWFRAGTKALTPTGHATRWQHLPRWKQTVHRSGGTLAAFALVIGGAVAPVLTLAILSAGTLALVLYVAVLAGRGLRTRRDRRTWLHPLHLAAHDLAGWPRAMRASEWITAEIAGDGAVRKASLELPPSFPADAKDKERLVSIASQKLGIEAAEPSWRLAGPTPLLTLTHSPPPPGHVKMADLLPELVKLRDDELLLGVGKNGNLVKASLASDSPHIAISMGTGAGKSNLASWLLLQTLLRGSIGLVLDAKRRLSYPWILKDEHAEMAPLPNVAYAWTTAQMHACMAWLSEELDRRGDVAFAGMDARGKVRANVGPRLFTLAEELNLAVPRLRAYWQENRGDGDPVKSPAFTGLGEVAFAGRQVRKHLVLIGQMLTAEATGSRDSSVKENCGIKLLARYGPKGWRIMAEDIPMPPPPTELGRIQVVTAGKAIAAQTPQFDGVEGRELVLASDMALLPSGMPCKPRVPATVAAGHVLDTPSDLGPETVSVAAWPPQVTLREAVELGVVHPSTTLSSLKMGRHRDPEFPQKAGLRGRDHEYDPAALAAWDVARRS